GPGGVARGSIGGDGGDDADRAGTRVPLGHRRDAADVLVAVGARVAEVGAERAPDDVAVEQLHALDAEVAQALDEEPAERRLAAARQTREPDRDAAPGESHAPILADPPEGCPASGRAVAPAPRHAPLSQAPCTITRVMSSSSSWPAGCRVARPGRLHPREERAQGRQGLRRPLVEEEVRRAGDHDLLAAREQLRELVRGGGIGRAVSLAADDEHGLAARAELLAP